MATIITPFGPEFQINVNSGGNNGISGAQDLANPAALSDGDLEKTTPVPIPKEGDASWIQYEFPQPQSIRSITFVTKTPGWIEQLIAQMSAPEMNLESSDDGQRFKLVSKLQTTDAPEHTISFAPVTAKYFRVTFKRTPPPPIPDWAAGIDPASFGFSKMPPPPTMNPYVAQPMPYQIGIEATPGQLLSASDRR